ncbi:MULTISPECIES: 2-amino-4-hydroxy-6-hydroxymethyldihydropteridine diphosphokinase [Aeromonas]|uniref:2-amino-4-hydroxy-6- hydroxymethyldihydropteridine diphosphokinase n=1 Tax=Aeromonas TaxID=642 RepID=UPI0005AA5356|nr:MULTISPECIES: 2-amino-4-hydroxy-6-hydroxymethyldihydropteridine diphosphokinase [Aeromonas]QXC34545.1 2-amino-4-hydroxy-6-hydroxymethyldihydropteridine diphosphokinase [Aeromonas sp. FDAARGOS 1407]UBH53835.1 2-amino-4-hydroxy-6-hydroxymethyldihydropteridine diphosphokinase [Aeromonas enteropelogenes]
MTTLYISLGSNIERERHIRAGLDALYGEFGELLVSRVFESEAVGFNGRPFYNLVVAAQTDLPLATVCQRLRAMEFAHGREADAKKFAPRTLDLDLLLYGDLVCDTPITLPRGEILTNAFVLWPLAELAPALRHPLDGRTMDELWQAYDKASQRLYPISFHWEAPALQHS